MPKEKMTARRPSTTSRVSQREDINNLPYYHNNFNSTEEVTHFIKKKGKNQAGHFLLRPSNRNRDLLTASVLVPDRSVRHTHIQIENDGCSCKFFLVVEKKFESVQALVDWYSLNPVKNLEGVNNVYFLHPLCRSDFNQNFYTPNGTPDPQRQNGSRTLPIRSTSMSSLNSTRSGGSGFSLLQNGADPPPPLPMRPGTTSDTSGTGSTGASGWTDNSLNSDLGNRPALPLPSGPKGASDDNPYYSRARDVSEDISQKLKDVLKSTERCECGIPRSLAELPMGWTVHLSKDPMTSGRLFYQNEEGTTSWSLPENVRMQLTKVHIQNLKQIDAKWTLRHPRRNTTVNGTDNV